MKKYLVVVYILLILLFTAFSYLFVDPNFSYLKSIYTSFSFTHRNFTTILYVIFIFLFFLFYLIFLKLAQIKYLVYRQLRFIILTISILLLFSYSSVLSYDIFNYIATAKVTYFYKENPYIVMPIEFTNDPSFTFVRAANKISLYGPVWLVLSGIPFYIGFNNPVLMLFTFKALNVAFYLLTIVLIWKISKNLISVSFFALNPLVIIEILLNSHNDTVMIFLALFSFYCLIKNKTKLSILFLILSILIKYATVFLIPVYVYALIKNKEKKNINKDRFFYYSFISMFILFLLSPIREEMYSWYAVWFIAFASFLIKKKYIYYFVVFLSIGLLLGYVPYMYTGLYTSSIILLKYIIIILSPLIYTVYYFLFVKKSVLAKGL